MTVTLSEQVAADLTANGNPGPSDPLKVGVDTVNPRLTIKAGQLSQDGPAVVPVVGRVWIATPFD